jgi:hypothetical protein
MSPNGLSSTVINRSSTNAVLVAWRQKVTIASANAGELITERRHEMEYDSRPQNLLSKAVDKVCEQNPRLVLMPYEQMKAVALELAGRIVNSKEENLKDALMKLSEAVDSAGHPGHHDKCELCTANLSAVSVLRWDLPHSSDETRESI